MAGDGGAVTAAELLYLPDDGWRYELRRGRLLREPPAGGQHGSIGIEIAAALHAFVRPRRLGYVFGADTGFLLTTAPDTVRAPDTAFVAFERLPGGPPAGYIPFAPDLAVEVVSPSDRAGAVARKLEDWLDAGTPLVWIVEPRRRLVRIVRGAAETAFVHGDGELTGEPILPGFRLPLRRLFGP